MIIEKLFQLEGGDTVKVAGRIFFIHAVRGEGMNKVLTMTTTRLFMGRDGRPTSQITITIEDLLNRLIIILKRR